MLYDILFSPLAGYITYECCNCHEVIAHVRARKTYVKKFRSLLFVEYYVRMFICNSFISYINPRKHEHFGEKDKFQKE